MRCTAFFRGMGTGLLVGIAAGAAVSSGKRSMKTQTGKAVRSMGIAIDRFCDDLRRDMLH